MPRVPETPITLVARAYLLATAAMRVVGLSLARDDNWIWFVPAVSAMVLALLPVFDAVPLRRVGMALAVVTVALGAAWLGLTRPDVWSAWLLEVLNIGAATALGLQHLIRKPDGQ